uniref:Autotransporter-associated beta strand repeat protein n=1 Tax=Cereibacter sphaeroides (strain ATCC 17025 / ATH 2.4.3) TaxID=349102 RepID=A4WZS0_CERS5
MPGPASVTVPGCGTALPPVSVRHGEGVPPGGCHVRKIPLLCNSSLLLWSLPAAALLALALTAPPALADGNADGVAAARAGRYAEAETLWRRAAEAQDPAAMTNLAGLYMSGTLGRPDLDAARDLFERAAALGDASANVSLGYMFFYGAGVAADPARAEALFDEAARAGSLEGRFMRGEAAFRRGVEGDALRAALEDLRTAAEGRHPPAMARVADLLRSGTYTERDVAKAIDYYRLAAESGVVESMNALGEIHLFAETGKVQMDLALDWLGRAAAAGDAQASHSLALVLYDNPDATEEELRRAFGYARTAAFAWNESAQLLLGRMYLEDRAVPQDLSEAYRWFDLAASAGVFEAHHLRAIAAARLGPEKSAEAHELARRWFDENHATPHTHRLLQSTHTFR